MTTIPLQSKTTITSATAATGVDISPSTYGFSSAAFPTNLRIWVRIYGADSTANYAALIQFQSSTNAFSSSLTHATFTLPPGPIGATSSQGDTGFAEGTSTGFPTNPWTVSVGQNDQAVSLIPFGTSSAVLRVNVVLLNAAHLTYESWFTFE